MYKMLKGEEHGNNNPALWRIGPQEDGIYLAVTDAKVATRFNISDLSTIGQEYPASYPFTLNGCAHWMGEVLRYRPDPDKTLISFLYVFIYRVNFKSLDSTILYLNLQQISVGVREKNNNLIKIISS